jgi:hypothetical protein
MLIIKVNKTKVNKKQILYLLKKKRELISRNKTKKIYIFHTKGPSSFCIVLYHQIDVCCNENKDFRFLFQQQKQ